MKQQETKKSRRDKKEKKLVNNKGKGRGETK
jgi:hypothetical protein